MLLDGRHRDIARIALSAAGRRYEVAFAGGGALQVHDVSARQTRDVDLFVRRARHVAKAADAIANALERAGYRVEAVSGAPGWEDLTEGTRDFEVYPPGSGEPVEMQVAFFPYTGTVTKDVGPVVTLDYLAARKTAALLERHRVRDYVDLASLVDAGYKVPQLLDMAFAEERSLTDEDVGDAGLDTHRASPPGHAGDRAAEVERGDLRRAGAFELGFPLGAALSLDVVVDAGERREHAGEKDPVSALTPGLWLLAGAVGPARHTGRLGHTPQAATAGSQ